MTRERLRCGLCSMIFRRIGEAWNIEDEFMFGPDLLVAPVLYEGARARTVYLPNGSSWKEVSTGNIYSGGMWLVSDAPIEDIPLFLRDGAYLPI